MRPELLESKLLRLESFDAVLPAEAMEQGILPRQRLVLRAIAEAKVREDQNQADDIIHLWQRYDEEQLALIGKAKTLRGELVRVVVEKGYVVDVVPCPERMLE